MTEEKTPQYITELKTDLIKHFDSKIESEINSLAQTIYRTVALKEDIKDMVRKDDIKNMATKDDIKNMATKQDLEAIRNDMATKDDIKEIWDNMATKSDVKEILSHIGRYEVRARNIEEILLEDHKPRIIDLEKEVYL